MKNHEFFINLRLSLNAWVFYVAKAITHYKRR